MSILARASVADLLPLERLIDPAYPEVWRVIATCLYLHLRTIPGVGGDEAAAVRALELAEILRGEFGGAQPYLAVGRQYEAARRFAGVVDVFNGRNQVELARERGCTPRHMYRVLKRDIAAEVKRRQGRLFHLPEDES